MSKKKIAGNRTNAESLESIETALFVVCLDNTATHGPDRTDGDEDVSDRLRSLRVGGGMRGSLVDVKLRAEAGREGCDAIYVKSTFPGTAQLPERASATCIVYTGPAPAAAAAATVPSAPTAAAEGVVLHAE